MDSENIAAIARGLSKARKAVLMAAQDTDFSDAVLPAYIEGRRVSRLTIEALMRAGLVYGTYPPRMWLNETGLAVRQHLLAAAGDA